MKIKTKRLSFLLLAAFALYVFWLSLRTVARGDDLLYCCFYSLETGFHVPIPFNSIWELPVSLFNHYMGFNGRITPHIFVFLFDGFLPRWIYALANAGVFALAIWVLLKMAGLSTQRWKYTLATMLVFYIGLFMLVDPCMSINYVWSGVMCGGLLLAMKRLNEQEERAGFGRMALLSVAALLCGCSHEAFSVPLSGTMFFVLLRHHKAVKRQNIWLILCFWIGTVLLVFAPGTLSRAAHSNVGGGFSVRGAIYLLAAARMLYLALIAWLLVVLMKQKTWKQLLRENEMLVWAIIVGFLFSLFIGYQNSKQMYGVNAFASLMVLRALPSLSAKWRSKNMWLGIVSVLCLIHAGMVAYYTEKMARNGEIALYDESVDGLVYADVVEVPSFLATHMSVPREVFTLHQRIHYEQPTKPMRALPRVVKDVKSGKISVPAEGRVLTAGKQNYLVVVPATTDSVEVELTDHLPWGKEIGKSVQTIKDFTESDSAFKYYVGELWNHFVTSQTAALHISK